MKASEVVEALRKRYHPPEWAFFDELRAGTGYDYGHKTGVEKRLDAWAFHLWPSGGYQPTGFEIKVSRSDFQRELRKAKENRESNARVFDLLNRKGKGSLERYMEICQFFYFVTPANLVLPREVPDDAGLIWVYPQAGCRFKKAAPPREMPEPEWDFFAAVCRRVADAGWSPRPLRPESRLGA